jgi:hypothetical protein
MQLKNCVSKVERHQFIYELGDSEFQREVIMKLQLGASNLNKIFKCNNLLVIQYPSIWNWQQFQRIIFHIYKVTSKTKLP